MSRLVCACGTAIPRDRAGEDHCSARCKREAAERERLAELLGFNKERLQPYEALLPAFKKPTTRGEHMLAFLREHPTLLDPAPADVRPEHIEARYRGRTHPCLRCGQPNQVTYVVIDIDQGNRWLDLCKDCDAWTQSHP